MRAGTPEDDHISASPSGSKQGPALPLTDLSDARLTVSLFCALGAIALACVYLLAQPAPLAEIGSVLRVLTLSLFLLLLPQGYRELHTVLKRSPLPDLGLDAGILAAGLASLTGLGWLRSWLPINPLPVFMVVGVGLLVLCLRQFWQGGRSHPRLPHLLVVAIALIFYLRHAWLVWGSCCLSPRSERRLLAGEVHIDTLFHSDITALFQTYGVSSIGVDGLAHLPYHMGSHWIFAQLAQLLDLPPFQFYNLAYPILILPLLFRSLLAFSLDVRSLTSENPGNLRRDWLFWGLLLIGFAGFMPPRILDLSIVILSESHLVAISLAFLALSLGLMLWQRVHQGFNLPSLVLTLSLGALLALITLTKVSVGFLLVCAAGYVLLRLRWYVYPWLFPCLGVAIALQLLALRVMGYFGNYPQPPTPWQWLGYLGRMDPARLPLYLLGVFAWSLTYAVLRLRAARITSLKTFWKAVQWREIVDLEAIALLCGLGLLPAALLAISGAAAYYFIDLQMWVSLSLLLGRLEQFKSS